MRVLPRTDADLVAWIEQRLNGWAADPKAIGLDAADLIELNAELNAARDALMSARISRDTARAATLTWSIAGQRVRALTARLVRAIKLHAETTDDPSVLAAAEIRPPKTPARLGPPEAPQIRSVSMPVAGHLRIEWSGTRAGGTQFVIFRQLLMADGTSLPFAFIDTSPRTRYIDRSLPPGSVGAAYAIEARRSGGTSEKSPVVSFSFAGPSFVRGTQLVA